jgi:hypothetical protein
MKIRGWLIVLGVILGSLPARAQNGEALSTVIGDLRRAPGINLVGLEFIGGRDQVADAKGMTVAIARGDFGKVLEMIAASTDYEGRMGPGSIVIVPKRAPAQDEAALSWRQVIFPDADRLPLNEFLGEIKSADASDPVFLSDANPFLGQILKGAVSFKSGGGRCEEVLDAMARQLKANLWIMHRMTLIDPRTGRARLPDKVGIGLVSFFAPSLHGGME